MSSPIWLVFSEINKSLYGLSIEPKSYVLDVIGIISLVFKVPVKLVFEESIVNILVIQVWKD